MAARYVIAYDVGTSGVKAVLADLDGCAGAAEYRPHELRTLPGGWVEQDLDGMLAALAAATRALLHGAGVAPEAIEGIGVTAQMFNVVPVDAAGAPLCPMLSWLDQRAAAQARTIAARMDEAEQFRRLGSVVTAKDILPRIVWLREERPDLWARTRWLLDCKEAVVLRLSGAAATDDCGASAYRLWDPRRRAWDEDACRALGVPREMLPDCGPATRLAGRLTGPAANALGLPSGVPVAVGSGDVAASQVGAGAIAPGDAHLSLGTATYFGITLARPAADPGGRLGVLGHMDPARWLLWLEVATGGGALAWLSRTLAAGDDGGSLDHAEVERLVAAAGETDELFFTPWLSGERVPVFDDRVRGAFVGLGLHHGRGHLLRALMEGVAYQIRWALEYGLAYGEPIGAIRAVGGGSIGETWLRIIADVLGRPLLVMRDPQDAGARGAAAALLVALGAWPDLSSAARLAVVEREVAPDPAATARHGRRYARYRRLYEALAPLHEPARAGGS